jgi:hypothetical protein
MPPQSKMAFWEGGALPGNLGYFHSQTQKHTAMTGRLRFNAGMFAAPQRDPARTLWLRYRILVRH